ncbi:MAG: dihydroorotate dehydrogenase [Geobacteraceae bacterium GWB2_52_12]|nr:MAG: dihydroorotate dehydrogenase [Geobacteraceae bacterium GWB2_52_12]
MKGYRPKRLPNHVGIIPDGNRRWAERNGLSREEGYLRGLDPGLQAFHICHDLGVREMTFYGFTRDNTKRPASQKEAFRKACVDAVYMLAGEDTELLVVGDHQSKQFPHELKPFTKRTRFGKGGMKVNFLVNYSWEWDLSLNRAGTGKDGRWYASAEISRIDLIIRWGGRSRLSGFVPIQSVNADLFVVEEFWPDFHPLQIRQALEWYDQQDVTLGG